MCNREFVVTVTLKSINCLMDDSWTYMFAFAINQLVTVKFRK